MNKSQLWRSVADIASSKAATSTRTSMIGAVIKHGHEVAITTDQHDTVDRSTIDDAHDIHAQIEIEVGLLRATGERLIVLGGDTIAQSLNGLQKHLFIIGLWTGWTVGMRHAQGDGCPARSPTVCQSLPRYVTVRAEVEQVRDIHKNAHALRRWEWRQRNGNVSRDLVRPPHLGHHAVSLRLQRLHHHIGKMIERVEDGIPSPLLAG